MRLSVIIPSLNGYGYLTKCIEALRIQTVPPDEVIVVDSTSDRAASKLASFDGLRTHFLDQPLGVPEMRSIAFQIAIGDVIAMTEDHCIPASNWCEQIRELHSRYPEEVIGGAVENGTTDTALDWACYFCEYLDFMLPLTHAPRGTVPGNNVSYKRSVMEKHLSLFTAGLWEFFVHAELSKQGVQFRMDPSLAVLHCKPFTASDFQSQSFYFARSFGAMRAQIAGSAGLWMFRFLSPALPALVMWRLFRKVMLEKKRNRKQFLLSLPWILWFQLCWCAGEITGYWFGDGGSTALVK